MDDARACYDAAVRAVQPAGLMSELALADLLDRPLDSYARVVVVGTGKASMAMAGALEERVPADRLDAGLVVVPHDYASTLPDAMRPPRCIEVTEGGHPLPDDAGARIEALDAAGVLAEGAKTTAYTYVGEKLTWDIYWHGTIGAAKQDLDRRVKEIRARLEPHGEGHR